MAKDWILGHRHQPTRQQLSLDPYNGSVRADHLAAIHHYFCLKANTRISIACIPSNTAIYCGGVLSEGDNDRLQDFLYTPGSVPCKIPTTDDHSSLQGISRDDEYWNVLVGYSHSGDGVNDGPDSKRTKVTSRAGRVHPINRRHSIPQDLLSCLSFFSLSSPSPSFPSITFPFFGYFRKFHNMCQSSPLIPPLVETLVLYGGWEYEATSTMLRLSRHSPAYKRYSSPTSIGHRCSRKYERHSHTFHCISLD
ncbi:uncharacterized protein ARMOST_16667 [Armillaria ostoyae]|uniref:Uncharacterized protein n=1 Tax=Armillaria ostoyae TaxID=47428 RepID=A0A284RWV3_ARMOS|nr:uncharacterized protein ARMOST_16667 [Armillaria ostoyae]